MSDLDEDIRIWRERLAQGLEGMPQDFDPVTGERVVQVGFSCRHCHGWEIQGPDGMTEDDDVWCKDCGAIFGNWGRVQKRAREVAEHLAKTGGGFTIPGVRPFSISGE